MAAILMSGAISTIAARMPKKMDTEPKVNATG
ncbi:MAG: hypothetical protein ACD_75C00067G0002 [uncultured bacterium]|nr:MAG: hypothetical protein ACD_75C00067G0002 [uncultured bacterium]